MTSVAIVDLGRVPLPERGSALISSFDRLAPGKSLVVVSGPDTRPLLDFLRTSRKGLFEWNPVGSEPRCFRVEVTRRDAEPGALRSVTEALEWDHRRLHALADRAFEALAAGDRGTGVDLYRAFRRGLVRHMRFEEELLFPVFEVKAGLPHGGPTAVMRAEHREIRTLLDEIAWRLEAGRATLDELRESLRNLLADHNRKEEALLYPGTDRLLTAEEGDNLVARIQAFPS